MVMRAKDILEEFEITSLKNNKKSQVKADTKEEQQIIDLLQDQVLHFDEIIKRTGFASSQLGTLLSLMEMKGVIKSLNAGNFCLTTK